MAPCPSREQHRRERSLDTPYYENALLKRIKAKKAGKKPPIARPEPKPSNVVNLFDALKKSLASEDDSTGEKPARRKASVKRRSPPARGKTTASAGKRRKSA